MVNLYRAEWVQQINGNMKIGKDRWGLATGYPGVIKWVEDQGGRFATWHLLKNPAGASETDIDYVIKIGCVFPEHPYFAIFLNWANEAADRALSDERFNIDSDAERLNGNPNWKNLRGWKTEGVYPGNHGKTLAAACFARALRDNSELDSLALLLACDEIAESALDGGSKMWDYIAQSEYLRCVRLALVAGNVDKAQHFLKNIRRKFKHTFVHQEWLQTLANAITESNGAPLGAEPAAHFQAFFDQVRDPAYKLPGNQPGGINLHASLSILRLELAVIKQRYIQGQPLAGNWQSVLSLISE